MSSLEYLELRARRIAKRVGLLARKSRWRRGSIDNRGAFMLIDPDRNAVIAGERFDLSAEIVIEFCERLLDAASADTG